MEHLEPIQLDFSIVSPTLTVEALRDSGYKDTDHAIAELIDNSIEAGARRVELIVVEKPPRDDVRFSRARISEIAVADDGEGMDATTLRRALRFGDGTRLDRSKRGIGRFGVGLPNASVSQCRRVDIWTWRNGADNALRCHLDLDEIRDGATEVSEPVHEPVPDRWRSTAHSTAETRGTLVVWSNLDKVRWRGGRKTLNRTAELCGRVYRKFLADEDVPIEILLTLATEHDDVPIPNDSSASCLPNDPLYLMTPSSTPEPFSAEPMFQLFNERTWLIQVNGQAGEIVVRCSMARPDAINEAKSEIKWPRSYAKAGDSPWGKHAQRNRGVSIVRAKRELEISQAWVNSHEPEERWWSVEVEFDPLLDEIFGVVNNKQHAHNFIEGASFDWKDEVEPDETLDGLRERLKETDDVRSHFLEPWDWIHDQIRRMRDERRTVMKDTRPGRVRHPNTGEEAEDVATNVINEQAEQHEKGASDLAPQATEDQKIASVADSARQRRVDDATARQWAEETVHSGRRVLMKGVRLGHKDAFFDVESVNDIIEVWLNDQHPVYEHLIEVVSAETELQTPQELADRLDKASFTLRMLLFAWSRYEDKAPVGMKDDLEDMRMDWGREARRFIGAIEL